MSADLSGAESAARPPGRRRGPYSNGIARRQQIVLEAIRTFGAVGYNGGSLRQIARIVGVAPAAISRYFASKEELLAEVLTYWSDKTAEEQQINEPSLARLANFRAVMQFHEEHRAFLTLFLKLAVEATNPAHPARSFMQTRYENVVEDVAQSLRESSRAGQIRRMSDAEIVQEAREFVAFLDGIELQFLLEQDFNLVDSFDYHWAACVRRWEVRPAIGAQAAAPTTH